MDPLCGGTRAARLAVRGELGLAWHYNPLGIIAVLAAALGTIRGLIGVALRRWLTLSILWSPQRRRIAWLLILVLTVVLEVRQQLHVDLLAGP